MLHQQLQRPYAATRHRCRSCAIPDGRVQHLYSHHHHVATGRNAQLRSSAGAAATTLPSTSTTVPEQRTHANGTARASNGSGAKKTWERTLQLSSMGQKHVMTSSQFGAHSLDSKLAKVHFFLRYKVAFGQSLMLIGSHQKLGSWQLKNAVELQWTEGDQWTAQVTLPPGVYEYKYVLVDYETKSAIDWQSGSNAVLAIIPNENGFQVIDNWGNNPGAAVKVENEVITREDKLQKWAKEMLGYCKDARRLQAEMLGKSNENQGLRNELAQLRMELSLERQAKLEREARITELQMENASLRSQLVQKTQELNDTLAEVLHMLNNELEDDEGDEDDLEEGWQEEEGEAIQGQADGGGDAGSAARASTDNYSPADGPPFAPSAITGANGTAAPHGLDGSSSGSWASGGLVNGSSSGSGSSFVTMVPGLAELMGAGPAGGVSSSGAGQAAAAAPAAAVAST